MLCVENYAELINAKVSFNSGDCSFSLSCENTKIPNVKIHQHFYLKEEEREALREKNPCPTSEIFYETYYDTSDFKFINQNVWIKAISVEVAGPKEFIIKSVKGKFQDYIEYSEEKMKELDPKYENVSPFVTFKVVREIRKFNGFSINSDTVKIDKKPRLSYPELDNEDFINKWDYTVFSYCSDHITEEASKDYKPLARSKIIKYMVIFEPELYCDIQDLGYIKQDHMYSDCEKTVYDDLDMEAFVKELNEHKNGW